MSILKKNKQLRTGTLILDKKKTKNMSCRVIMDHIGMFGITFTQASRKDLCNKLRNDTQSSSPIKNLGFLTDESQKYGIEEMKRVNKILEECGIELRFN